MSITITDQELQTFWKAFQLELENSKQKAEKNTVLLRDQGNSNIHSIQFLGAEMSSQKVSDN